MSKVVLAVAGEEVVGNLNGPGQSVGSLVDASHYQSVSVQLSGTFVGTAVFEVSNNGTDWVSKTLISAANASASSATAVGMWAGDLGAKFFRVRCSAFTSGTIVVTLEFSGASQYNPLATQPVSGTVTATISAGATAIAKAEDAVHASGDTGVFTLGVRRDAPTIDASASGDYGAFKVDQHGAQIVRNLDSQKRTYAAAAKFTPVAGIIFEFSGAASTTIEINRLTVTLFGTAAGACDFQLVKNSALATAGTPTAMTKVPYDSADAAAVATARYFTTAPTAGAAVGVVRQGGLVVPAANQYSDRLRLESGQYSKSLMLTSATQALTLLLAGTLPAGAQVAIDIEWTEF